MKIVEALKKVKDYEGKVQDLTRKVELCSADTELDTPLYENQKLKVAEWLQSIHDLLLELELLKYRIQKTNINTAVEIELDGKVIKKSITQWIIRRQKNASLEMKAWQKLTDKGLQMQATRPTNSTEVKYYKVRLYFNPEERDKKIDLYKTEPSLIDGKLEIVNAVTDLME